MKIRNRRGTKTIFMWKIETGRFKEKDRMEGIMDDA
jgi:hypothetical protein